MTSKKQKELPGLERPVNKKVAEKGDNLVEAIAENTKARVARHKAELELIEMMKAEGVNEYVNTDIEPPVWIVLGAKDTVKLKKWKPPEDRGGDDSDDEGGEAAA